MTALPAPVDSIADRPPPRHPGLPAARWVDVDGLSTWCAEAGEGPPLLLVYGGHFGGTDLAGGAFCWSDVFGLLRERHRVIVYDKPGQGFTDNPADASAYRMSYYVEHLIGLIEALGLEGVHLVGQSRGGFVAMRAALERQDLVSGITLINSGTLSPGVGTNEVVLSGQPFPPFTAEAARWSLEHYAHDPASVPDWMVEAELRVLTSAKHQGSVARGALYPSQFVPELRRQKAETLWWLDEGRLQRPTQVIWGRNDRTARLERGLDLFATIARGERRTRLSIVDRCGHNPHQEHPRWVADLITGFVAGQGR
jgi:2-hydroxy-6-oxonona-2,4-dienedioate hydrolase